MALVLGVDCRPAFASPELGSSSEGLAGTWKIFLLFISLVNKAVVFSSPGPIILLGCLIGLDWIPFLLFERLVTSKRTLRVELLANVPWDLGVKNRENFRGVMEGFRVSFRPFKPYLAVSLGEIPLF
jgi:hypothetical protein